MAEDKGTRSNPPKDDKAQDGEKKMKQRGSPLFPSEGVITLRVEGNPKRKGSKSYDRFKYRNGMTVSQAIAQEGGPTYADLKWDSEHGFIAVNETPEMRAAYAAEQKAKAEKKAAKETAKAEKAKLAAEKKAAAATDKKAKADAAAAKAKAKEGEGSRASA
jgi:hypothetical protein